MVPDTTTIRAVESVTAAVNWARVETVVVVPPLPPVVLKIVLVVSQSTEEMFLTLRFV